MTTSPSCVWPTGCLVLVVQATTERGVTQLGATDVTVLPAQGLRALVDQAPVLIGTVRWLQSEGTSSVAMALSSISVLGYSLRLRWMLRLTA